MDIIKILIITTLIIFLGVTITRGETKLGESKTTLEGFSKTLEGHFNSKDEMIIEVTNAKEKEIDSLMDVIEEAIIFNRYHDTYYHKVQAYPHSKGGNIGHLDEYYEIISPYYSTGYKMASSNGYARLYRILYDKLEIPDFLILGTGDQTGKMSDMVKLGGD